jgi:AcrR family transcriptional regulator
VTQERRAQKARTRHALLEGARALLVEGRTVTVAAAAAQAGISKATAYRYFSDPDLLAAEAGLAVKVKPFEDVLGGARSTRDKVRAVSLYFFDLALENEAAFRQFLARSLDAWKVEDRRARNRRGARRVAMFESALADVSEQVGRERIAELVRALTAATGTEAMIALLDVAQADRSEARVTVRDTADALLDRYLGPRGR